MREFKGIWNKESVEGRGVQMDTGKDRTILPIGPLFLRVHYQGDRDNMRLGLCDPVPNFFAENYLWESKPNSIFASLSASHYFPSRTERNERRF